MIDWKRLYKQLARAKQGSWRALGRQTGIAPATFTRLKKGRSLSSIHLIVLSRFLNITPSELIRAKRTSG